MPNTRTIYRRNRKRPSPARDGADPVARQYEGGREAPFSPQTPETSDPDSPAVTEAERRAEAGNTSRSAGSKDPARATSTRSTGGRKPRERLH